MRVPIEAQIIFEGNTINDIEAHVNSYANFLYSKGMKYSTPFGIYVDRSPNCLFIMLAAIHIGIPFMPIDKSLLYDRIKFMLEDSGIQHIITMKNCEKDIAAYKTICIDDFLENVSPFISEREKNEIVYILYTSGSTGKPKGVEVKRDGFFAFIDGVSKIIDFTPQKRIACLTTSSFDIFFLESIMSLYKGLAVVLATDDECINPRLMSRVITNNQVNMIQITPSRLQLLLNYDSELKCLSNMSEILVGGEPFPYKLLTTLQRKTHAKIYNMYGPTETTIWSTISELTDKKSVDIGKPIDGTQILIVDEDLNLVPEGETGEICIAGKGLAKVYINNTLLTNEKFIELPEPINNRIYRTGDFGKYVHGVYVCNGRKDNQVKIRSYRVELEEIECSINDIKNVDQAIVALIEQDQNGETLTAFYTGKSIIDTSVFKKHLKNILPKYMIPSIYVKLGNIPHTSNGKVNRRQIITSYEKMCEIKKINGILETSQSTDNENLDERILKIISENSDGYEEINPQSDFTDLGLDSITFIKIIVDLECEFDFEFDDEMLLFTAFPDVYSMVCYVKSKVGGN